MLAIVSRSACNPAPPVGSQAEKVMTTGSGGGMRAGSERRGRDAVRSPGRIALDFAAHDGSDAARSLRERRILRFGTRAAPLDGVATHRRRAAAPPSSPAVPSNYLRFTNMKTWMCLICGWIYDEAAGAPEEGLAAGTRWEDVPDELDLSGVRRPQGRLRDDRGLTGARVAPA